MRWIVAGRQISQAVKNVKRLRQIVAVFAKHGFNEVIENIKLGKFSPAMFKAKAKTIGETTDEVTLPERLRAAFEELGPTFVKLGQLLSTRPDIIPDRYIEEFTHLQDNVKPLDYESVRKILEEELGQDKFEEIFCELKQEPLASASIAQAHEAMLNTGEKVVLKIQRPGIKKSIETDISILAFIADLLEKYIPESRVFNPKIIVEEFFRVLSFELDFKIEANNTIKMAENFAMVSDVVIPKVYKELSSSKVLVLERIDGIRVNDVKAMESLGVDKKRIVDIGARACFKSVMFDGFFHGDLHGGNLFVLPGNRLGIIDFGIVGRLSKKARKQFASMVLALVTEDYENLCYQYAELGNAASSIDFDSFQREIQSMLSPFMGLPLKELNVGRILLDSTRIATKYKISVPGDWMLVFKSIFTIEGMGRILDPDFDMLTMAKDLARDLVKKQYSPQAIAKDSLWTLKELGLLLQVLPRQIRWMFKKFNSNDFAIEIKSDEIENIGKQLELGNRRMGYSIMAAGLFVAASVSIESHSVYKFMGYPIFSVICFGLGVFSVFGFWRKK